MCGRGRNRLQYGIGSRDARHRVGLFTLRISKRNMLKTVLPEPPPPKASAAATEGWSGRWCRAAAIVHRWEHARGSDLCQSSCASGVRAAGMMVSSGNFARALDPAHSEHEVCEAWQGVRNVRFLIALARSTTTFIRSIGPQGRSSERGQARPPRIAS